MLHFWHSLMQPFLAQLNISPTNLGGSSSFKNWLGSSKKQLLTSINPATDKVIASVHTNTSEDYQLIMQKAEQAFPKWAMMPAPVRGALVRRVGELLRENKDSLGALVSMEMGKIKAEGLGEVQEMIDMADFSVGLSRTFAGNNFPSERPYHRLAEQWHPLGIVGVISAFNFPVAVWAWNAFIAAVCGNITLWKPSSKTPLCAIAVQHLCNQAMKEMGIESVFSLMISENSSVTETMVADTRIPLVSFTGSTQVGLKVHEMVSRRLGRSILEMSGNNAVIVDETADLELALRAIVFGAVGTTGQRCTTTRRLYIHHKQYDALLKPLKAAYQQVNIGDPLEPTTLVGPLVDKKAVADYEKAIERIKTLHGEIIHGGKVMKRTGCFVEPTLVKAKHDWDVVQEETFAPILYVMPYENFDEAIQMQNNVRQGLSSALFSTNMHHIEQFLSAVGSDCGIANVNTGTSGAEIGGAFGGEKETGGGREAGSDSWKAYMRRQTSAINWGKELPLAQGIEFKV